MPQPVFRFAPSPNGYLHLGHALSALRNSDLAQAAGGRLLLRIEDIDAARCRPEFEAAIYEDLAWLGVQWEEPVRRQSEHLDAYRHAIAQLEQDALVYASFESRGAIARLVAEREVHGAWPRDPDGAPIYPGSADALVPSERAARMAAGEPYVLRLDMRAALAAPDVAVTTLAWSETGSGPRGETGRVVAAPEAWGDVVLARKDTPTSYHVSVVVDDALQGITDVVRGEDLFASTSVHRLLQTLLRLPAPVYRHHRLVLDADGRKLSKSTRATALRALREQGATPADIRRMVGLDRASVRG
jgi:glutamyl-Q tRNA(Asp) synthetase